MYSRFAKPDSMRFMLAVNTDRFNWRGGYGCSQGWRKFFQIKH